MLKFRQWLRLHKQALQRTFSGILHTPYTSLSHIFFLSFMVFVPLMLVLVLNGMQLVGKGWQHNVSISLYMDPSVSSDVDTILTQLKSNPNVASVKYISASQGLLDLQQSLGIKNINSVD